MVELLVVPGKNEHRSFFVLYQGTTLSRAAKFGRQVGLQNLRENLKEAASLVGALCFSRGEQRFSVAENELDFDSAL